MINVLFKNVRGVSDVKITANNNDMRTEFGQFVLGKIEELKADLQEWDGRPPVTAEAKEPEAPETPEETKAPEAPVEGGSDDGKVDELKENLEKSGGFQTSPPDSSPSGQTNNGTDGTDGDGVKVTGGEHDPAEKQPQPGDEDHKTDPNEGQDPVDSNPPKETPEKTETPDTPDSPEGGEDAKSSDDKEDSTDAPAPTASKAAKKAPKKGARKPKKS